MKEREIIIIVAAAENNIIGKGNTIPWHIKEDLQRFKSLTQGYPCIMGRRTYQSLPKRPLPNRDNLVISRTMEFSGDRVQVFSSLQEAMDYSKDSEKVFICGGASIYREAMEFAHRLELTRVHSEVGGDTLFPEIDTEKWQETQRENHGDYSFITYKRIS